MMMFGVIAHVPSNPKAMQSENVGTFKTWNHWLPQRSTSVGPHLAEPPHYRCPPHQLWWRLPCYWPGPSDAGGCLTLRLFGMTWRGLSFSVDAAAKTWRFVKYWRWILPFYQSLEAFSNPWIRAETEDTALSGLAVPKDPRWMPKWSINN